MSATATNGLIEHKGLTASTLGLDPERFRPPCSPLDEDDALCGLEKCLIMANVTTRVSAEDAFDRHIGLAFL